MLSSQERLAKAKKTACARFCQLKLFEGLPLFISNDEQPSVHEEVVGGKVLLGM